MSTTSTSSRQTRKGGPGDPDDNGKPGPNRIICSLQSTGRIGKSTVAQALISWFGFAGVEFAAIDADGEHQTLSRWYPDIATRLPFRETDDLLPVLNEIGSMPAMLIDYPAQSTQALLSAFAHFQAFDFFESKNTRLTSLIFASDERPAMASAAEIITTFGPRSDYIIVKNPARFQNDIFMHSQLPKMLAEYAAPTIEIGRITRTRTTLEHLDAESAKAKKALTFREAEKLLPPGSIIELQSWRNRLFAQFEDACYLLLPAKVNKHVERPQSLATAKVDPYTL
jgi:hypothetical protein